jgi:Phage tail tube protein
MAGRYLRLTEEAAYGTFPGSPVSIYPRLSGPNAFVHMTNPDFFEVMDGSGLNVPVLAGTATTAVSGQLTTELTYTQAAILLGAGCTRINAGQTAPWTTTELPNDLASFAADFAYQPFDSTTYQKKRFLGCKANSVKLTGSKDQPKMMLSMGITGSTPQGNSYDASSDPTFSNQALSSYPTDVVLFQHLKSGFTAFGGSVTNFDSVSIEFQNLLKPYWDEGRFCNALRLGGRRITVNANLRLKSAGSDRTRYENNTKGALQLVFTNGTNTITFNFESQCYLKPIREDFPLTEETYYQATYNVLLDQSAGTDFALTVV